MHKVCSSFARAILLFLRKPNHLHNHRCGKMPLRRIRLDMEVSLENADDAFSLTYVAFLNNGFLAQAWRCVGAKSRCKVQGTMFYRVNPLLRKEKDK